jgi:D-glycero-alpha-D-manno-heptose 1-phosphate guanylyltransferase
VLVVNGDSLTLTDLDRAFSRLKDENLDGVLVGIPVQDTSRYGALDVNEQGLLQGFREKQPGSGMINCGIYLFRRRLLETIPLGQSLSLETDVIPHALSKGAQIAVVHPARTVGEATFLDIGTPQTVHQASAFIARTPDAFPALPAPLH